jgi:hypothetical protein
MIAPPFADLLMWKSVMFALFALGLCQGFS